MNLKQTAFVQHYMECGNGAEAAIKAGYSEKDAKRQATRLSTNIHIKAEIDKARAKLAAKNDITLQWISDELVENHRLARIGNPLTDRYGNPTGEYMRNLNASNVAVMGLGKLYGHLVEKRENTNRNIDAMSEEDLRVELTRIKAERAKVEH